MPIQCPIQVRRCADQSYRALDYGVMKHVFDTHNLTGRFCAERIQRRELERRLLQADVGEVRSELPITVSWRDFTKHYRVDLLVADAAIYELKACTGLNETHRAQLLNYLLLLELAHGKLLNFRGGWVEWQYVTTRLTLDHRRHFTIDDTAWKPMTDRCLVLRKSLEELLADWGAFLELSLYQDALIWALGGESHVLGKVVMRNGGTELGEQTVPLVSGDTCFRLTAYAAELPAVESHWRRFLALTPLRALHWINLHQQNIRFMTLLRS